MANALFNITRNVASGDDSAFAYVDVLTSTMKAMFVDHADDTPVVATDQDIADIVSGGRVPAIGSCPQLGTKTIGSVAVGVFDAEDTTFTALSGDQSESLIIFYDSTVEATSRLFAFWDTATGLPLTPNGGDVTVTWNASGIWSF
jgi:hypothetical protein